MSSETDVRDYVELVQLRHKYCHYLDDGEYESWADLFTEDGTFAVVDGETYTGQEEIVAFAADDVDDRYEFQAHTVSNPVIETDGDEGTGKWFVSMPYVTHDGHFRFAQGRYDDEYRRVDGEWKFATVRVSIEIRRIVSEADRER